MLGGWRELLLLGKVDAGVVAVWLASLAAVPGSYAAWKSLRKNAGDVVEQRDAGSWARMEASVARTEADLSMLRSQFDALSEHARRCDADLACERKRNDRLEATVADLTRRLDAGGTPP